MKIGILHRLIATVLTCSLAVLQVAFSQETIVLDFDNELQVSVPPPSSGECDDTQGVFGIENGDFVIREKEGTFCCHG